MQKNKTIRSGMLYRGFAIEQRDIDEEKRTVKLSFSSEDPVERYFGKEILSHKPEHVDLSFLSSGTAPLLREHWTDEQIGVIESAEIGQDNKGRATVRFGTSDAAKAEFNDVKDKIRNNVSVGYRVRKMILEEDDEETGRTYRATDWMPLEISLVSIPADMTVGVGRSKKDDQEDILIENEIINRADEGPQEVQTIMDEKEKKALAEKEARERQEAIHKAKSDAVAEVREIIALGDAHNMRDEANKWVNEGRSAQEFKDHVLAELQKKNVKPVETPDTDQDIGLTRKEAKQFSFMRAIRALAHPGNRAFQKDAGFEFECSQAVESKSHRTAKGLFVPTDVLRQSFGKRDLEAQIGTAGGYLVDDTLAVGSFIETLENAMVVKALGAIMLRDLVGDISIPKQTGGATAYWIGEGEDVTESAQTFGQVALRPRGVGAYTDITRKMMLQSSLDVENLVRNDLALRLALAIDLASLSGAGAANEPLGIINTTGVGSVTLNAANTPDWGDIVDLVSAVAVDNALTGRLAYTCNATIEGNMRQTVKHATATVGFILEGNTLNGYPFMMSNQVAAKYILFGNWADLVIGQWSGVDINVDTSSLSTSGGTRVVALQDVDVAVRHAESFAVGYKS
jgi:HK97 family phage major capsid protein/HK97 family phage prohead protease